MRFKSILLLFMCLQLPSFLEGEEVKHVLLIESTREYSEEEIQYINGIYSVLRNPVEFSMEIDILYLEKDENDHSSGISDLMRNQFLEILNNSEIDLIIAINNSAFTFTSRELNRLNSAIPVVGCGISTLRKELTSGYPNITAVFHEKDISGTIALAKMLQPELQKVVLIIDPSILNAEEFSTLQDYYMETEQLNLERWYSSLPEDSSGSPEDYNNFVYLEDIIERSKLQEENTVFLLDDILKSRTGKIFNLKNGIEQLSTAVKQPIYTLDFTSLNSGSIGGKVISATNLGEKTARIGMRVLKGESVRHILLTRVENPVVLDYKALEKYHISSRNIPAGHYLVNKPDMEETYRQRFLLAVILIAALLLLGLAATGPIIFRMKKNHHRLEKAIDQVERQFQEKINAQQALSKSEAKFKTVADLMPVVLMISNAKGEIEYLNKDFEVAYGYSREETTTITDWWHMVVPEVEYRNCIQKQFEKEVEECTALQQAFRPIETNLICKDGSVKTVEIYHASMGEMSIWVHQDITNHKTAETNLKHAKDEAEIATRLKSEFLANMSHEIRTPMNAIIGMTNLAIQKEKEPKIQEYLRVIDSSAKSLLGLINDILDFSKIEAGKMAIENIPFDLGESMEQIADIFRERTAEKNIELVISIHHQVPKKLIGDPLRIVQIFLNLVSNAVKFTDSGEIVVQVKTLEESDSQVVLDCSVTDTGIGIQEERLETLFDSFTQADGSTTRKYGGTGLGLAISKTLVEMMKGEISVESAIDEGSTFHFTLEIEKQEVTERNAYIFPQPLNKLKVLAVDDNDNARMMIQEILSSFPFEVTLASSGEEALSILKTAAAEMELYNLVLMDWKMPGLDGLSASRQIKQDPVLKETAIILLTAFGTMNDLDNEEESFIDAFLMKPLRSSNLFDTIISMFGEEDTTSQQDNEVITRELLDKRAITGANILLIEDNPMNQKVAMEILKDVGVSITTAENGELGVDTYRKDTSFDIILMDVQMPVMDGYEAAEAIRSFDMDIPIIAMTANAMKGDREKCLNAGMNDYISKPIDVKDLFTTLRKWIRTDNLKARPLPASSSSEEIDLPGGIEGFELKEALRRLDQNKGLLLRMLKDFLSSNEKIAELKEMTESGRIDEAIRTAHTLKGNAGTVGATTLQNTALKIETALKEEKYSLAKRLLNEAEVLFSSHLHRLQQELPQLNDRSRDEKDDASESRSSGNRKAGEPVGTFDESVFQPLWKAIEGHSFQAKQIAEDMQKYFRELGLASIHTRLTKYLKQFNFKDAKKMVEDMKDQINTAITAKDQNDE